MTNDDFLLDQIERSQRQQTRRRREDRSRRRRMLLLGSLLAVVLLVLGLPSIISHSPIARSMLSRIASSYGLDAHAESVQVGWITPLKIRGLEIKGLAAGSQLSINEMNLEMTVSDLWGSSTDDLGQIGVRGLHVVCQMHEGRCSLEDDLALWMQESGDDSASTATVQVQDVTIDVTDAVTAATWKLSKSNAEVELTADAVAAEFAGVLTEPSGSGGSLQGSIHVESGRPPLSPNENATAGQWTLELKTESLPLSVVSLVRRRFPVEAASVPQQVSGDATGSLALSSIGGGPIKASLRNVELRNLTTADPSRGMKQWHNQLATIHGDLLLLEDRVVGRGLKAVADFASLTFDGAFSKSVSLAGESDNPLLWLDKLDGTATATLDLASLDRALPGMLPLRDGVSLGTGSIAARVESLPHGDGSRKSQLEIRSEAIRGRSGNTPISVEPIELVAIVSNHGGQVRAERFELTSSFATAVGRGELRSGAADMQVDFGRLSSTLQPVVDLSTFRLGGSIDGKVQWNATPQNLWKLTGSGRATNLLISVSDGHVLQHADLQGEVDATGRWLNDSLAELTAASVRIETGGLDLQADLTESVRQPNATTPLPVRVRGTGRIETLADLFRPWVPEHIRDAQGGFKVDASGTASTIMASLTGLTANLTQPRLIYSQRTFEQPSVKLQFTGQADWPSGDCLIDSMTLEGMAISAAARGESTGTHTNLEIAWRADLERLQGSVQKRMADRSEPAIRQVGYVPGQEVTTEQWLVMGDCEGKLSITDHGDSLAIETHSSGKNIAVVQPPAASSESQMVGPARPRSDGASASSPATSGSRAGRARVVWFEPNVKIDGVVRHQNATGRTQFDGVQLAGDWFATTLSGEADWNAAASDIKLSGPARLKMNEVARRLSSLAQSRIVASGLHETQLDIEIARDTQGNVAFTIGGNLGWETVDVAGIALGPASVPIQMTETSVLISPAVIPVGDRGQINLVGNVHYRPGPVWIEGGEGLNAKSVRLTPEMTHRWLKFIAPLAASATQVEGTFSAEIDDALVVLERPEQSRVRGRLNIEGFQMSAGPLANQVINSVGQLKALASVGSAQPGRTSNVSLISMPPQTVEFQLADQTVSHRRLMLEIDRAQVITSGQVSLDGRLNMVAQVPLDARWLGGDLQGFAGEAIVLPIDGTLTRPSLDSHGVRDMVARLGMKAAQGATENYLQKQLDRSQEQLNKGLEKLRFDRLFGL